MSPRSMFSLVLVFGLVLAFTDARAFKERPKRQVSSNPGGRCTSQDIYDDLGEINIGSEIRDYQNNEDCCFLFTPPIQGEFTAELEFNRFEVEWDDNCAFDYLSYSTSNGNEGRDCGIKNPFVRTFTSTGSFEVCFHSDQSVTKGGINFYYYFYQEDDQVAPSTPPVMNTTFPVTNTSVPGNITNIPMNTTMLPTPMATTMLPTAMSTTMMPMNTTTLPGPMTTLMMNTTYIPFNTTFAPTNFTFPPNVTFPSNVTFPPNVTFPSNVTVAPNTTCNRFLTGRSGNFTSPGFNSSYPSRQDCVTTIRGLDSDYTIEITFGRFDIEDANNCVYDYLEFDYAPNKTEKGCGTQWRNRTIELDVDGGDVTALFHSDGSVQREGFSASYVIRRRGVPRNRTDCVFNARQHRGMIQSLPGTGANYENNLNCSYIFNVPRNHSLHFNFSTFDVEGGSGCPYDYVQINGGRKWCGTTINERRVNATGEVVLRFKTDGSVTRRGFVANYVIRAENGTSPNTTVAPSNVTVTPTNVTVIPSNVTVIPTNVTIVPTNMTTVPSNVTVSPNTTCNRFLTGRSGNFTSPGFNSSYPSRQDCVTTIRGLDSDYTIEITFGRFDIEDANNCIYDYLEFDYAPNKTEKGCGTQWRNRTIELDVDGGAVTALFHSDGSVQRAGFSASYVIRPRGVPRNRTDCVFNARQHRRGMIQSLPGTGANYENNLNCSYIFNVPRNHSLHFNFSTFDVEGGSRCPYDYVQINGGRKWCGTTINERRVNGTGEVVLRFRTDGSVTRRGFVANYVIRADNGSSPNTTVAPSNVTVIPTNVTFAPTNVTFFPTNMTFFPTNMTFFPTNWTVAPTNVTFFPTNVTFFPTNTTFAPTNMTFFPTNMTFFPTNMTFFPTNGTFAPTNTTIVQDDPNDCSYISDGPDGSYTLRTDQEGFYDNRQRCEILLNSPPLPHVTTINFTRFDVEADRSCRYDSLDVEIGDVLVEKLCGNNRGPFSRQYRTNSPLINMTFTSDGSVRGLGFAFDFETEIEYCNAVINGTSGAFRTPPGGYSNNMHCTYTINTPTPAALTFNFSEFNVEYANNCVFDALSMGGQEKLCGSSPGPRTYFSNGTFVMTFTSDGSVTGDGFYVSFTSASLP